MSKASAKEVDWGAEMDASAHEKGYESFLRFVVGAGAVSTLILVFLALFLL